MLKFLKTDTGYLKSYIFDLSIESQIKNIES